jgi:hypothetical protein
MILHSDFAVSFSINPMIFTQPVLGTAAVCFSPKKQKADAQEDTGVNLKITLCHSLSSIRPDAETFRFADHLRHPVCRVAIQDFSMPDVLKGMIRAQNDLLHHRSLFAEQGGLLVVHAVFGRDHIIAAAMDDQYVPLKNTDIF